MSEKYEIQGDENEVDGTPVKETRASETMWI
jgi:hypothetical protein